MDTDRVLGEVLLDGVVLDEEGAANEAAMEGLHCKGSVANLQFVSVKNQINFSTVR